MFSVGQLVVYGGEGVCRVEFIGPASISQPDSVQQYYHLQPLYRSGIVLTPIDTRVLMRPILSRQEIDALLQELPSITALEIPVGNPRLCKDCYHRTVMSYDCRLTAALIKAISAKRSFAIAHGKKASQLDDRYLKRAQEHLYGEIAAVLDMERADVEPMIRETHPAWPEE